MGEGEYLMLSSFRIVVLGGGKREIEIIRQLVQYNAIVKLVGYENWKNPIKGVKIEKRSDEIFASADALLLPALGCSHDGRVDSEYTTEDVYLQEKQMRILPQHCIVFTGKANEYVKNACTNHDLTCVELLEQNDLAIYNSIPTAEGAVMLAMQHTDFTIHGSYCVVLGLGRIGFTLARTLHALGAKVMVGIKEEEEIARAHMMSWGAFYLTDLATVICDANIVFNTIPAIVINESVMRCMCDNTIVIDLASSPGGYDKEAAKTCGIKVINAPGLPGIVAPQNAGKAMAKTLIRLLLEHQ